MNGCICTSGSDHHAVWCPASGHTVPLGSWVQRASCVGEDMFPRSFKVSPETAAMCEACPVRSECLEFAVTSDQRSGVWGGARFKRSGGTVVSRRGDATVPAEHQGVNV